MKKKDYRVIIIHSPIQLIINTDKTGLDLTKEIKDNVLKTKAYPQDILVTEIKIHKNKKLSEDGKVIDVRDL